MKTDENLKGGAGIAEIKYPADFFPEEGFKGIHDPIHARALILESGERIAVISLDASRYSIAFIFFSTLP